MTQSRAMDVKSRSRYWATFVLAALAVQFLIFLALREPVLDIFRKDAAQSPGASSPQSSFPDAIVAITIEIEGEEPAPDPPADETTPHPPADNDSPQRPGRGNSRVARIDILDITGEAQTPIPSEPSGLKAAVPPRPIEITWPQTDDLGHCLELQISIDMRVSETGEVLEVTPVTHDYPDDCIAAALEAARRIKFLPGQVKGRPAEMSTRLRIDFRKKR